MNTRISESEDQLFIQSPPLGSTRTFTQYTVSRSEIIIRVEIRTTYFIKRTLEEICLLDEVLLKFLKHFNLKNRQTNTRTPVVSQ